MHDDLRERDRFFIDGRWTAPLASAPAIEVTDSSTGGRLGSVPAGGAGDVDRARGRGAGRRRRVAAY